MYNCSLKTVLTVSLIFLCFVLSSADEKFEGLIVENFTKEYSPTSTSTKTAGELLKQGQLHLDFAAVMLKVFGGEELSERDKEILKAYSEMKEKEIIKTYVKNNMIRIEEYINDEFTVTILDSSKNISILYPTRKSYRPIKTEEILKSALKSDKSIKDNKTRSDMVNDALRFQLKETEESKQISGHMCQKYIQQKGDVITEFWITNEISIKKILGRFIDFMQVYEYLIKNNIKTSDAILNIDGFPMLTMRKVESITERKEVVKIERKDLENNLFILPSDYNEIVH